MKKNFFLSILVSTQLITAFLLQIIIVKICGASATTDIYLMSLIVPVVIQSILSWVLASLWLPRLSKISEKNDVWNREFRIAHTQTFVMAILFGLVCGLTVNIWYPMILPAHLNSHLADGLNYVYIVLFSQFFNTLAEIFIIASRSVNKFVKIESLLTSMILIQLIASCFTLPVWGIESVLWLGLIRALLVYAILVITSNAPLGINVKLLSKSYWVLSSHLLAGGSIYKTAPLVDRYWASQSQVGGLTLFNLAFSIMSAISTIIQRSFSMPLIPMISQLIQQRKFSTFISLYRKYMSKVAVCCCMMLILGILLKPVMIDLGILILGLEREELAKIWLVGACLTVYVFASTVGLLTVNSYYAMGDTKTPTIVGIGGFSVSLIFKAIAFVYFGLPGLALAISAYYFLNMVVLDVLLKRTFEKFVKSSPIKLEVS
jgi:peptidoglycan biosynthesis protein MviN/MurJ (putative lipid II flippase)